MLYGGRAPDIWIADTKVVSPMSAAAAFRGRGHLDFHFLMAVDILAFTF
jgi:hypothetical protein